VDARRGSSGEYSKKRLWAEEARLPRGRRDEVGTEEKPALARDVPGGSGPVAQIAHSRDDEETDYEYSPYEDALHGHLSETTV